MRKFLLGWLSGALCAGYMMNDFIPFDCSVADDIAFETECKVDGGKIETLEAGAKIPSKLLYYWRKLTRTPGNPMMQCVFSGVGK